MTRKNWYWDINLPYTKIKQILTREDDPRFPRIAGTLLARVKDHKQVFGLISQDAFCRRFRAIEHEIKSDEWTKEKAAFWKATYLRLSKELKEKGIKINLLQIRLLWPFPKQGVMRVLAKAKKLRRNRLNIQ